MPKSRPRRDYKPDIFQFHKRILVLALAVSALLEAIDFLQFQVHNLLQHWWR